MYKIVKEIPFEKVCVGEMGLLLDDVLVEVDGDREVVRVYKMVRL